MLPLVLTCLHIVAAAFAVWMTLAGAVIAVRFRRPVFWVLVLWGICQIIYELMILFASHREDWLDFVGTGALLVFAVLRKRDDGINAYSVFLFWR